MPFASVEQSWQRCWGSIASVRTPLQARLLKAIDQTFSILISSCKGPRNEGLIARRQCRPFAATVPISG
jgi:hypothetical protein